MKRILVIIAVATMLIASSLTAFANDPYTVEPTLTAPVPVNNDCVVVDNIASNPESSLALRVYGTSLLDYYEQKFYDVRNGGYPVVESNHFIAGGTYDPFAVGHTHEEVLSALYKYDKIVDAYIDFMGVTFLGYEKTGGKIFLSVEDTGIYAAHAHVNGAQICFPPSVFAPSKQEIGVGGRDDYFTNKAIYYNVFGGNHESLMAHEIAHLFDMGRNHWFANEHTAELLAAYYCIEYLGQSWDFWLPMAIDAMVPVVTGLTFETNTEYRRITYEEIDKKAKDLRNHVLWDSHDDYVFENFVLHTVKRNVWDVLRKTYHGYTNGYYDSLPYNYEYGINEFKSLQYPQINKYLNGDNPNEFWKFIDMLEYYAEPDEYKLSHLSLYSYTTDPYTNNVFLRTDMSKRLFNSAFPGSPEKMLELYPAIRVYNAGEDENTVNSGIILKNPNHCDYEWLAELLLSHRPATLPQSTQQQTKYKLYEMETTWNEAQAYCESVGGYLAVVNTQSELEQLKSYTNYGNYKSYWLGEISFVTIKNKADHNIIRPMLISGDYSFWWNATDTKFAGFICEWD